MNLFSFRTILYFQIQFYVKATFLSRFLFEMPPPTRGILISCIQTRETSLAGLAMLFKKGFQKIIF